MKPVTEFRRSDERFLTRTDWLHSRHSFSFGPHYDAANTHFGLLVVSNDDVIQPNTGFMTHPHQDMEIVTWVLSGELEHKDSVGHRGVIYPGLAQRMSAGTGIWHSEMNPRGDKPVHLVQMWVFPDAERVNPGYEQLDISDRIHRGGLVPIASGKGHDAAISIRQKKAVLWGGRLKPAEEVKIPAARHVHLYIARGQAQLEGAGALSAGDAVRLTVAGERKLIADPKEGAEVLIWEMG